MNDRFEELTVFVRVGESGSFTRAARDMHMSQPSVSRIVRELESRLGVRLVLRTTRRLTLTAAGQKFLESARDILGDLGSAEDTARGMDSVRGTIRIAIPVVFGTREVVPRLPAFLKQHPSLRVDLLVSDLHQDLVAEGIDVAIRLGGLADSSFGARLLATMPRYLVATPAYLEARGVPTIPAHLANHDCIFGPNSFGGERWHFKKRNTVISVNVSGRIRTDSGPGLHASVLAGLGIARASAAMAHSEIVSGALVNLLPGYTLEPVEIHAVMSGGPRPSSKVRAFTDFMTAALGDATFAKN